MTEFEKILEELTIKDLTQLPSQLFELLKKYNLTICTAESITGGDIASTLVQQAPGISQYLLGGIIAYSNLLKVNCCLVNPSTINRYGSISQETTLEMAKGLKKRFQANINLAVTGYAENRDNPKKGLAYFSILLNDEELHQKFQFEGERFDIIKQTTFTALNLTKNFITKNKGG